MSWWQKIKMFWPLSGAHIPQSLLPGGQVTMGSKTGLVPSVVSHSQLYSPRAGTPFQTMTYFQYEGCRHLTRLPVSWELVSAFTWLVQIDGPYIYTVHIYTVHIYLCIYLWGPHFNHVPWDSKRTLRQSWFLSTYLWQHSPELQITSPNSFMYMFKSMWV